MKRRLTNVLFPNHEQQQHDELAAAGPIKRPRRQAAASTRQPNYLFQSSLSLVPMPPAPPPPPPASTFVLTDEFKGPWHFWNRSDNVVTPCKPVLTNHKNSSWYCDQCSFVNWHWQLKCDMCGVKPNFYNPSTTATLTASSYAVKGWHCAYCGADDNNARRSACRLCGLPYRPPPLNSSTAAPTTLLESLVPGQQHPSSTITAALASPMSGSIQDDNDWLMCDDDGVSEPPLDSVIQMELPD